MLTSPEKAALRTFHQHLLTPGKMLCFSGPNLEKHEAALQQLAENDFLVKEKFKGAYSLTRAGYTAMKSCSDN